MMASELAVPLPSVQHSAPSFGSRTAIAAAFATILSAFVGALVIDAELLHDLGREDSAIEVAGAACFLIAALGFLAVTLRLRHGRHGRPPNQQNRTLVFAALSALMFICHGEEISWGQRIFGWHPPRLFVELNAQRETNIHNLQPFHQWNPDGTEKGFAAKLVNMNRLFSIFWLVVFVLVPIAAAASPSVQGRLERTGLPVPPLWTGCLFLTSYMMYKVVAFIYADTIRAHALDELKETCYAAIYALIAVVTLVGVWRGERITQMK